MIPKKFTMDDKAEWPLPEFLDYDANGRREGIEKAYDRGLRVLEDSISYYLGQSPTRQAIRDGLRWSLQCALMKTVQGVLDQIAGEVVSGRLDSARQATATMFEALAAGAIAANRSADPRGTAEGFAIVSAIEGRPEPRRQIREDAKKAP